MAKSPPKPRDISYHGLLKENADLRPQIAVAQRIADNADVAYQTALDSAMKHAEEEGRLHVVNQNLEADNESLAKRLRERPDSPTAAYGVAFAGLVFGCIAGVFWAFQPSAVLIPGNCTRAIAAARQHDAATISQLTGQLAGWINTGRQYESDIDRRNLTIARKDRKIAGLIEQDRHDRRRCEDMEATEGIR